MTNARDREETQRVAQFIGRALEEHALATIPISSLCRDIHLGPRAGEGRIFDVQRRLDAVTSQGENQGFAQILNQQFVRQTPPPAGSSQLHPQVSQSIEEFIAQNNAYMRRAVPPTNQRSWSHAIFSIIVGLIIYSVIEKLLGLS
jgi:hypothetical protein